LRGEATKKRGHRVQLPCRRRGARPRRAGCQLFKEGSLMFRRIVTTLSTLLAVPALVVPLALVATAPTAAAADSSSSGPPGVTVRPVATATAAAQPTLRLGARGGAVVTLQQRLAALHYFDVSAADGVFGQNTYHAVIAFQKVQGLGRDGIVGSAT